MNYSITKINQKRNKKELSSQTGTVKEIQNKRNYLEFMQEQKNKNIDLKINSVLSGLNFDDSIKQTRKRIKFFLGVVGVGSFIAYFGITVFLCWAWIIGVFYLLALCEGSEYVNAAPVSRSSRQINIDVNKEYKHTN